MIRPSGFAAREISGQLTPDLTGNDGCHGSISIPFLRFIVESDAIGIVSWPAGLHDNAAETEDFWRTSGATEGLVGDVDGEIHVEPMNGAVEHVRIPSIATILA